VLAGQKAKIEALAKTLSLAGLLMALWLGVGDGEVEPGLVPNRLARQRLA